MTGTLPVVPDANRPLAGVRGLLLDLDGVLILAGRPIPGAVDALTELERRGVPYRIVTNTSLWSRAALARYGESVGMRVSPDRIWSALSVSAAYTRRRFEHQPLYVLASEDARSEFVGQWLLSNAEAAARGLGRGQDVAAGYRLGNGSLALAVDPGDFARGGQVRAEARYDVTFEDLPLLNWARVSLTSRHAERIDAWRSRWSEGGP